MTKKPQPMDEKMKVAWAHAMLAKQEIFKAQDAIGWDDQTDHDHVRDWLDHLRSELEAFDRACQPTLGTCDKRSVE